MVGLNEIFPIGIGTYRIDQSDPKTALKRLRYSLDRGQNFLSTGFSYGDGAVVELLSTFFAGIQREQLFLCVYAEPDIRNAADVEQQLDSYLKRFATDYVDCYQIHIPYDTPVPLEEVYEKIFALREKGKVRYVGASNVSPTAWEKLNEQGKLDFLEGIYNFECRNYEKNGVMADCRQLGLLKGRLEKDFTYRLALKYGLIEEKEVDIHFYFEEVFDG